MLVKLTTLLGYEECVIINESCTVEALLNYLVRTLLASTGPDHQKELLQERLFLSKTPRNNLELVKGFMLTDYGIKDGSTIFVYLKLEDGEFKVTGMLMD